MAFTDVSLNAMLDYRFVDGDKLCLHDGDSGGVAGTNEISGGSPAYARKTIDYDNAASGDKLLNGTLVFDIPAGADATHWSIVDTTGATLKAHGALASPESFTNQGTYTVTEITLSL